MKKYAIYFTLALIGLCSVLYLIPNFTFKIKDTYYSFHNLPGLGSSNNQNLNIQIPGLTYSYKYTLEAVTAIDNRKDWNALVAQDQKTLEKRIEAFTGEDYEIRLDRRSSKPAFTVTLNRGLAISSSILTANNSSFTVLKTDSTQVSTNQSELNTNADQSKKTPVDLKRSNFASAEINQTVDSSSNEGKTVKYQVRLPVGFVGPDTIKTLNNNIFSTLSVKIGDQEYSSSLVTSNETGAVDYLLVNVFDNYSDALKLQTLLNTPTYNLGYKLISSEAGYTRGNAIALSILIATFIITTCAIAFAITKKLSIRKLLIIILITVSILSLFKLFGFALSFGALVLLSFIMLLTLSGVRGQWYLAFGIFIFFIKLLGYLYLFSIEWNALALLFIAGLVYYFIANLHKFNINKKYA